MKSIIYRDLYNLTNRYSFWALMGLFSFIIYLLYFLFLNEYTMMQSSLKGEDIARGVTDIALIPYIKTASSIGLFFIIICFSRLFYYEQFSDFSLLFRSINYTPKTIIGAKTLFIIGLIAFIIFLIYLPIFISGIYFHYDINRLIIILIAGFLLYFSTALTCFLFSQLSSYTAICAALSIMSIATPEILSRVISQPIWLSAIIKQLSLIHHFNQITFGIVSTASLLFFISYIAMMLFFIQRNICNSYLQNV